MPDWDDFSYDFFRGNFKIVVPKSLKNIVMEICHDHRLAGHLGRDKTHFNVSLSYWWKGMAQDIAFYVKTCPKCQLSKVPNVKCAGEMIGYRSLKPFDLISIDFIGPLPRATKSRNNVLLIILDVYSKIVELCPLAGDKTEKMVNFLFITCCRYGFPTAIISDNGPEFISVLYTGLLHRLGIKPIRIAPHVSKCNPVERVNRNIKEYLRSYVEHNHKSWDESLPELMYMLRSIIHVSTGLTPSQLMFGRKLFNPLFNRLDCELVIPDSVEGFELNHNEMVETLKEYASKARELMEEAKVKQSYYHDLKVSESDFKIGDVVKKKYYVLSNALKNISSSLEPKFEAPLKIIGKLGSNIYILSKIDKNEFYTAAHSSQLFHYYSRESVSVEVPDEIKIPLNTSGKKRGRPVENTT